MLLRSAWSASKYALPMSLEKIEQQGYRRHRLKIGEVGTSDLPVELGKVLTLELHYLIPSSNGFSFRAWVVTKLAITHFCCLANPWPAQAQIAKA